MSFIRRQTKNQNTQPRLDPNAPAGPTTPQGATGSSGVFGSPYYNNYPGTGGSPVGATGASCTPKNGNTVVLPNGVHVLIPFNGGGWHYNISIPTSTAKVKSKDDRDGCDCVKCKEFYPFAEPNQEDGTLICYSCRNGY